MTCYNSELPIGPPGPTGPQGPQGPQGTTLGYKVYTALLTQSGETAPVAIVLENTLGEVPVWSYSGIGSYQLTSIGLFLANKTFVLMGSSFEDPGAFNSFAQANRYSNNIINIFTGFLVTDGVNVGINPINTYLNNTPIEIRIYP